MGEKHPSYGTILNNLAALHRELGDYRAALPLLQQALAINKELLGEKHPHYALSLHNLGHAYRLLGDYRAALPVLRAQHSGLLVQISSTAGIVGGEFTSAYAAAKFGVEGWFESLAPEIAPLKPS